MHQVPVEIWRSIDQEVGFTSKFIKGLVAFKDFDEAYEEVSKLLLAEFDRQAVSAFMNFGILFLEHEAISKFIMKNGFSDLRNALPELLSLGEVFEIYKMDRMRELDQVQKHQVELMLYRALDSKDDN